MLKKLVIVSLLLVSVTFLLVRCGPKKPADGDGNGDTPTKKTYTPTGNEGSVTGVIKFEGPPPPKKTIDMGQDANCANAPGEKTTDDVVVTDGKLASVFVYVKGPKVDEFTFSSASDPVVLDQKGCRYDPRVLGLRTGQVLRVTNSDPTTHNVHPTPAKNVEWNQSQTPGQGPIEKKFTKPETLIPVKCNQHPWMKAHVGVLDHPFYNVSAKDGSYKITGLPPGDYTIVAWHEMGGDKGTEKTEKITVAAKESKTLGFTFGSGMASAPPAHLKVEPALVLP